MRVRETCRWHRYGLEAMDLAHARAGDLVPSHEARSVSPSRPCACGRLGYTSHLARRAAIVFGLRERNYAVAVLGALPLAGSVVLAGWTALVRLVWLF